MKPILITPGDAAGIGPEVALRAAAHLGAQFDLTLVGPRWLWQQSAERLSLPCPDQLVDLPRFASIAPREIHFGVVSGTLSRLAMECVRAAAELCRQGHAAAVVTAPITKAGIEKAGYTCKGHTDFLADILDCPRHAMMLSTGDLHVVLVTHHIALRDVPGALTAARILEKTGLTHEAMLRLGADRPRIAVCGLNPHSGEGGMLGEEEESIIRPAIIAANEYGIDASGPHPSDTLFHRAAQGEFDAVIAMYHDQGLIPVKLLGFETGVNTTIGLPIVRTSPDHGSAYDRAGRGMANPSSMIEAIKLAARLAESDQSDRSDRSD